MIANVRGQHRGTRIAYRRLVCPHRDTGFLNRKRMLYGAFLAIIFAHSASDNGF
jgi:hypothetical protein